jgi:hypothetical protein
MIPRQVLVEVRQYNIWATWPLENGPHNYLGLVVSTSAIVVEVEVVLPVLTSSALHNAIFDWTIILLIN